VIRAARSAMWLPGRTQNSTSRLARSSRWRKDGGTYVTAGTRNEEVGRFRKGGISSGSMPTDTAMESSVPRHLYCAKEKGKFWEVHDLLMSAAGFDLVNNKVKNDVVQGRRYGGLS
jgi:hypothetical protein